MKLTEENADYMDCRPGFNRTPINMDLVPEHLRGKIKKQAAAAQEPASQQATKGTTGHRETWRKPTTAE
jgi:hypothetical protein